MGAGIGSSNPTSLVAHAVTSNALPALDKRQARQCCMFIPPRGGGETQMMCARRRLEHQDSYGETRNYCATFTDGIPRNILLSSIRRFTHSGHPAEWL